MVEFKLLPTLLLSLGAAIVLQFIFRLVKQRRRFNGLPQPPSSFLWGHLKVMGEVVKTLPPNMHPQAYMTTIAKKYNLKGLFYLDLWPIADSQIVLIDPDLMNQVTVQRSLPIHSVANELLKPVFGDNVIAASNGAIWKKTHNAMAPAFSWGHIRNLSGVFIEEAMHFRKTLDSLAQTGEVFSLEDQGSRLVFDVIARVVFNLPLHAQTTGCSYLGDLREMIRLAEATLSYNPLVKISAFFKRRVILGRLHPSITAKIEERYNLLKRDAVIPSRKDPYSVLDLMLREKLQESKDASSGKIADELTPEYLDLLLSNIKGLLAGGSGTTTDAICYMFMLLSKHPEVVKELREEHDRVFGKSVEKTAEMIRETPQILNQLEYTTAVLKETLRLFPPASMVRQGKNGDTITYENQSYPIFNDLMVFMNPHSVHYDAKFFPDPLKFDPARFMDPNNNLPHQYFWTFGRGSRACLGQNLALEELRVITVMVARDYDFTCADLKPNQTTRSNYFDFDTVYGDIVFPELGIEAKPRGGMMRTVKKE